LIEDIKEDTKIDYQKALIILDGNEIVASELDKINPNKISSMSNFTTSKKLIENYLIPQEVDIQITTKKNNMFIRLNYEKIEVNQEQEIYFTIPENYESCN
jgi:hypothetical protein